MSRLDSITEEIRAVAAHGSAELPGAVPDAVTHAFRPDLESWHETVDWALRAIYSSELDKVVLARETAIQFKRALCAPMILQRLKENSVNCFHFLFQPRPGTAFLGASPERLFRREGRSIESEAVAGTRPKGNSAADDARLVEELMRSAKEQREHEFVRLSIQEEIAPIAAHVAMDVQPTVMRLATERHLLSRMRAILRPGITSLDVLRALHPSPAVGGYPITTALQSIREKESFDRGWYAGPVGWIGPDAAEFAAGIRSGLISGSTIRLYSGAGIVRGSEPRSEWNEIGHKIGDFARALGLSAERRRESLAEYRV